MKKLKCLGVAAMATLLLTSCLEGGENSFSNPFYGVLSYDYKVSKTLFYINDYEAFYVPTLESDPNFMGDNVPVFAILNVNRDSPENADYASKGYYTATVDPNSYGKLDKYPIYPVLTDTTKTLDDEILLTSVAQQGYSKIKDQLFLGLNHSTYVKDQKNTFELSYDRTKEPEVIDGKRVYDFFIRVVKTEDGKGATLQNPSETIVFNGSNQFDLLVSTEQAASSETLNLRINYAKSFNSDSTKIATWGSEIIKLAIPKKE